MAGEPSADSTMTAGGAILSGCDSAGNGANSPGGCVDEDTFNLEIRKFLKRFGVTAQREIEKAVDEAMKARKLRGSEVLPIHATLVIPGVLDDLRIDGEIALGAGDPPR